MDRIAKIKELLNESEHTIISPNGEDDGCVARFIGMKNEDIFCLEDQNGDVWDCGGNMRSTALR